MNLCQCCRIRHTSQGICPDCHPVIDRDMAEAEFASSIREMTERIPTMTAAERQQFRQALDTLTERYV